MLRHYLLLSFKVLARRKFYTAISIFGISFTLMVLMIATALLDHAFGPARPELEQDRMLILGNVMLSGDGNFTNSSAGYQLLDRHARNLPGVERITFFNGDVDNRRPMFVDGRKIEPAIKKTDAEFWQVFDFDFVEGRP